MMTRDIALSIVVPAYNEEARLEPTIRSVIHYIRRWELVAELIVVDDGSRDRTSDLTRALSEEYEEIRLIRLPENCGKGHAVRTGVINAWGRHILFMDADGATAIDEIERLMHALQADATAAIAIGSRELRAPGVHVKTHFLRRPIGRVFHGLVSALTVHGIRDTQCGFKMFSAAAAHDLFSRMRMSGYSFDVEVLLMAQHRGYTIVEVPVNWTHQAGSRVNLVVDSLRMLRDIFIIRGHALRGDYNRPHIAALSRRGVAAGPAPAVSPSTAVYR